MDIYLVRHRNTGFNYGMARDLVVARAIYRAVADAMYRPPVGGFPDPDTWLEIVSTTVPGLNGLINVAAANGELVTAQVAANPYAAAPTAEEIRQEIDAATTRTSVNAPNNDASQPAQSANLANFISGFSVIEHERIRGLSSNSVVIDYDAAGEPTLVEPTPTEPASPGIITVNFPAGFAHSHSHIAAEALRQNAQPNRNGDVFPPAAVLGNLGPLMFRHGLPPDMEDLGGGMYRLNVPGMDADVELSPPIAPVPIEIPARLQTTVSTAPDFRRTPIDWHNPQPHPAPQADTHQNTNRDQLQPYWRDDGPSTDSFSSYWTIWSTTKACFYGIVDGELRTCGSSPCFRLASYETALMCCQLSRVAAGLVPVQMRNTWWEITASAGFPTFSRTDVSICGVNNSHVFWQMARQPHVAALQFATEDDAKKVTARLFTNQSLLHVFIDNEGVSSQLVKGVLQTIEPLECHSIKFRMRIRSNQNQEAAGVPERAQRELTLD